MKDVGTRLKCNLVNFEIPKNGSAEQGGEFQGIRGKIGPQTLSVRDRKTISAMPLVWWNSLDGRRAPLKIPNEFLYSGDKITCQTGSYILHSSEICEAMGRK